MNRRGKTERLKVTKRSLQDDQVGFFDLFFRVPLKIVVVDDISCSVSRRNSVCGGLNFCLVMSL